MVIINEIVYKADMTLNMFDNSSYSIVTDPRDIVSALKHPYVRAVTLRDPRMAIDSDKISAVIDSSLAKLYWHDESHDRKRRSSGKIAHLIELSVGDIAQESREASIQIDPDTVATFTKRCNECRAIFKGVFQEYTGMTDVHHRGYTLFTPAGGRGRAPELHIDNTILTLHWSRLYRL